MNRLHELPHEGALFESKIKEPLRISYKAAIPSQLLVVLQFEGDDKPHHDQTLLLSLLVYRAVVHRSLLWDRLLDLGDY